MKEETKTAIFIAESQKIEQAGSDFERLYPRIKERKATLSMLDISPRTFVHWKEQGLVWHVDPDSEKRSWVRLNVYEYVWLKAVKAMREFGLSLENIHAFKIQAEKPYTKVLSEDRPELGAKLEDTTIYTDEQIANFKKDIANVDEQSQNLSIEDQQAISYFGTMINLIFLLNDRIDLIIRKKDDGLVMDFDIKRLSQRINQEHLPYWEDSPHLCIPLYPFVEEMIQEPKNDSNIQEWGLINANERKVLDAIRMKNFRQIIIKPLQGGDDFIIELTTDENVMGDQAKRIKTILGLDQYSEVTIKYRNDKNLLFRNTRKL